MAVHLYASATFLNIYGDDDEDDDERRHFSFSWVCHIIPIWTHIHTYYTIFCFRQLCVYVCVQLKVSACCRLAWYWTHANVFMVGTIKYSQCSEHIESNKTKKKDEQKKRRLSDSHMYREYVMCRFSFCFVYQIEIAKKMLRKLKFRSATVDEMWTMNIWIGGNRVIFMWNIIAYFKQHI